MQNGDFVSVSQQSYVQVASKHWRLIGAATLIGALSGFAWQAFQARHYTSYASFIGQSKRGGSPLAGFAAQFGLAGIGSDGAQSPQFFDDLVTSPGVLRETLKSSYSFVENGHQVTGTLVDIYDLDPRTKSIDERLEHAAKYLSKRISTSLAPKTGLISLQVQAPHPDLAVQIATTLIQNVDAVNLRLRQRQAQADRQFAESRVAELGAELHAAEERLSQFMQTNKDYRSSPRLSLEQERLSREVEMRQSVYGSMAASYEQDRIESVRDNPVITVVDSPIRPAKPDSRGLAKGLLVGTILGAMLSVLAAYLNETWSHRRAQHELKAIEPNHKLYEPAGAA